MSTRRPPRNLDRRPLPVSPITTRAAGQFGWSVAAQRHAVCRGDAARPRRGTLVATDRPEQPPDAWQLDRHAVLLEARAAALTCPRAAISHSPAAVSYGLPTLAFQLRPCLTVPAGTALRSLARVHLHRAGVQPDEVVDVGGYRTLGPARTVLDVAREHGVDAGVIAADHALHTGLIDVDGLGGAYERCAHWPGRRAARLTVLLADGRAESPLESLSRLRMVAAGLPLPRPQVRLADRFGRFIARCDFYWDEFGVVGEADGETKYRNGEETPVARERRAALLRDTGLIVQRWGWADLPDFAPTAARLQRGFGDGARVDSPRRNWVVLPDATGR